jgi:hypothetical protein
MTEPFELEPVGDLFKPQRRTVRILPCVVNQPVLDWILMNILEACQVRRFKGKLRFPEIVPNLSTFRLVNSIDPTRRSGMKSTDDVPKTLCARGWCLGYEVVMI